jgi:sRNA-binding protein
VTIAGVEVGADRLDVERNVAGRVGAVDDRDEAELAAARDELKRELVTAAVSSAASSVKERLKPEDQQRLADEYLAGLARAGGALRGRA